MTSKEPPSCTDKLCLTTLNGSPIIGTSKTIQAEFIMFIRGYLRASTQDQDANRARAALSEFAIAHGHKVATFYVENVSGAKLEREELNRLIDDSHEGDVLLIEQVDRLSRLQADDWDDLKARIKDKGINIVSLDLHTSHTALTKSDANDDFTKGMIKAINGMLLDRVRSMNPTF